MRMNCFARKVALLIVLCGVPLTGQQTTGYLKTNANPGRAGVFIDGKYVGPAENFHVGRKYVVAAGEHEVRLVDPRYEDVVRKVTVQAGKTTKLNETLKPLPPPQPPFGRLRTITSDKFAAVYVNEKFMGHADEFSNSSQGLLLEPGDYLVKVVPLAAGEGHEERVKIEANQVAVVRLQK